MKRTTNRLAGPALRRFFEQFLENDGELERSAATRVAHRLTQAIPAALVRCDTAGKLWTLHRMRRVRPCATSAPQATPIRATPTSGAQAQGLAPTDGAAGDTAAATAGPTAQTTPGAQAAAQPLPSQPPQAPPESAACGSALSGASRHPRGAAHRSPDRSERPFRSALFLRSNVKAQPALPPSSMRSQRLMIYARWRGRSKSRCRPTSAAATLMRKPCAPLSWQPLPSALQIAARRQAEGTTSARNMSSGGGLKTRAMFPPTLVFRFHLKTRPARCAGRQRAARSRQTDRSG